MRDKREIITLIGTRCHTREDGLRNKKNERRAMS
jgi:hypothetical protein